MVLPIKRHLINFFQWMLGVSLIGLLTLIGIITLVDPNQFKSALSTYLQEKTGKKVVFQGPLLWQLDPFPSITAYDVSTEITDSASILMIQTIRLQPKLSSLFSKQGTKWLADGTLSIKLEQHPFIESSFKTELNIQDNLSKAHIVLAAGKLYGIDLAPLLQHAHTTGLAITSTLRKKETPNMAALLNAELNEWKKQATKGKNLQTPFQTLSTTITVENGHISMPNIQVLHPHYTVNGQGTLDLNNHTADYQLSALLKPKNATKAIPLTIRVQGALENLSVSPELAQYTHTFLPATKTPAPQQPPVSESEHELEQLFGLP